MFRAWLLPAALSLGIGSLAADAASVVIQDFETPLSGWTTQTYSSVSLTSDFTDIYAGSGALSWTYSKTTTDNWNNEVRYTFSSAQDWSGFDTFSFYLKGDTTAESGKTIRIQLISNGTSITGSSPFAQIDATTGYAPASFSLSSISSDTLKTMTGIVFYVSGSQFTQGSAYTFLIDNIAVGTTAVPEPSAYALLAALACCLFAALKRTRSKS